MERSEVETTLRAIWVSVLGVSEVAAEDDFFEMGGHSLLAIDMIEQVRERTGVQMTMADLHRAATLTELADKLVREMAKAG